MGPVEKTLRDGWALIEDPDKRCIRFNAVNANGNPVEFDSEEACKWCAIGAVCKANYSLSNVATKYLYMALGKFGSKCMLSDFNDADVINNPPKVYELAIELAAKDGA